LCVCLGQCGVPFDDIVGFGDASIFPHCSVGKAKIHIKVGRAVGSLDSSLANDGLSVLCLDFGCDCQMVERGEDRVVKGGEGFFGGLVTGWEPSYFAIVVDELEDGASLMFVPHAIEPFIV
jgi:hypothetical protein